MDEQLIVGGVVIVNGQTDLFEIVAATHPTGCFPSGLNRRQPDPDENADNCNHDLTITVRTQSQVRNRLNAKQNAFPLAGRGGNSVGNCLFSYRR